MPRCSSPRRHPAHRDRPSEQVDRRRLEDARADTRLDVVRRTVLDDHATRRPEGRAGREQQTRRAGPDDHHRVRIVGVWAGTASVVKRLFRQRTGPGQFVVDAVRSRSPDRTRRSQGRAPGPGHDDAQGAARAPPGPRPDGDGERRSAGESPSAWSGDRRADLGQPRRSRPGWPPCAGRHPRSGPTVNRLYDVGRIGGEQHLPDPGRVRWQSADAIRLTDRRRTRDRARPLDVERRARRARRGATVSQRSLGWTWMTNHAMPATWTARAGESPDRRPRSTVP